MSEGQNGKGDSTRNVGPKFKEHHPEIDWRDKSPQRICAHCSTPINPKSYVVVGSRYYCNSDCRKGIVTFRPFVWDEMLTQTLSIFQQKIHETDENR